MTAFDRRGFLRIAAASTAVGIAGCNIGDDGSGDSADTDGMDDGMAEETDDSGMNDGDVTDRDTDDEMTEEEMTEAEMTEAGTDEEMTEAGTEETTEAGTEEMTDSMGTTESFAVTITNVSEPGTITTSDGDEVAVPLSPTAYAVHADDATVFEEGESASDGLESLAEDGMPDTLVSEAETKDCVVTVGAATTADDADSTGPLMPGERYTFEVEAGHDQRLTLATMFVQSNDLFYAPDPEGIALFDDGDPVNGDVTDQLALWDAGTEQNQEPGAGPDQAPRQSGPDTGPDENATVRPVENVTDEYEYPDTGDVIEVTLSTM